MLSLRSYGVSSFDNQTSQRQCTLPKIASPSKEISASWEHYSFHSKGNFHPLYRTSTGSTFGKVSDVRDMAMRPKSQKCRKSTFTRGFITGPYEDTSLASIDTKKSRLDLNIQKKEARKRFLKDKNDLRLEAIAEKQEERRLNRERRRIIAKRQRDASVCIQRRIRGFLARKLLNDKKRSRDDAAAGTIQNQYRSYILVKNAKAELYELKTKQQCKAASKLQFSIKNFVARKKAVRELLERREERMKRTIQLRHERCEQQRVASTNIQKIVRGMQQRVRFKKIRLQRKTSMLKRQQSTPSSIGNSKERDTRRGVIRRGDHPSKFRSKQRNHK